MKIEDNSSGGTDERMIYRYEEDRLNQKTKKKKGGFKSTLIILCYLFAVIAIMVVVGIIMTWLDEKISDSASDMAVAVNGELEDENSQVTLTQKELDERISAAADEAVASLKEEHEKELAQLSEEKDEAVAAAKAEVLEGLREELSTGEKTMVEVLRPFYPDELVLVSGGKFHFVPINRELAMNSYSQENLVILESGELQYTDGENVTSHKGIDVSRFQGDVNWKAVAEDGVEFAFVRVANRGYGTGKLVEDDKADKNLRGASQAGIHVGAYIYSQAINDAEAVEEANLAVDKMKKAGLESGVIVCDVEKTADASGRMNQLSLEERTNLVLLFCQTVEAAGYKPMVYYNLEMSGLMLDIETLEQYDKWFAYYRPEMYNPYEYKIWQYSDKGSVKGIKGHVDLNISFGKFWEE